MFSLSSRVLFWIALSLSLTALLLFWLSPPLSDKDAPETDPKSASKPEPSPLSSVPPAALTQEPKAPEAPLPKSAIAPGPLPPKAVEIPSLPRPQAPQETAMDPPSMVEDLDAGYEAPGGLLEEVAPLEAVEETLDAVNPPFESQD